MDQDDRIVSSDNEELILVDADDRETGHLDKGACHDGKGVLHRAFSLFVFDDLGRLLLQQRSDSKRLWPLYWSNSCCSHPRRGESMEEATQRRLRDELNIGAELEFIYKFTYRARYGEQGAEHELCWVYLGRSSDEIKPNRHEIAATRSLSVGELQSELDAHPGKFTPWFKLEWERLRDDHTDVLQRYTTRSAAPS